MPCQAAEQDARRYATNYGSASAALKALRNPGYEDAYDREVTQALYDLAYEEAETARQAVAAKASLYLNTGIAA